MSCYFSQWLLYSEIITELEADEPINFEEQKIRALTRQWYKPAEFLSLHAIPCFIKSTSTWVFWEGGDWWNKLNRQTKRIDADYASEMRA